MSFGFFVILLRDLHCLSAALEGVTNLVQIAFISLVAFPVWALNIAVDRIDFMQNKLFLASSLLVMVTLIIPLLVKNQNS